ncbi:MAG TPA: hypothetical protein VFW98_17850 [Gemmatimonadaceae bacterium]|nr:hypothetical protein [Gemmatimonadaceae bacterium]
MALWNKLKQEMDHVGDVAQGAFDEGRVRLDAMRARQHADKAAQALGYAVYRARQRGEELNADDYARLSSTLAGHEAEAARNEERLAQMAQQRKAKRSSEENTSEPEEPPPPAS